MIYNYTFLENRVTTKSRDLTSAFGNEKHPGPYWSWHTFVLIEVIENPREQSFCQSTANNGIILHNILRRSMLFGGDCCSWHLI